MLTVLRRIIQDVSGTSDFKEAMNIMVNEIAKTLGSDACSIFLLDRRLGEYVLIATRGLNPEAVGNVRIPLGKGLIGLVGEREEPINITDAVKHPKFLHIPEVKEEAYRAFLGVPVIYHRQILGVLFLQQKEPRRYDESEEAFLITLATQLAAIIAHADATGQLAQVFERQPNQDKNREAVYTGIAGAPGIGIGRGVVVYPLLDLDAVPDREPEDVEAEVALLESALEAARQDMKTLGEKLSSSLHADEQLLFDAYQHILDRAALGQEIINEIRQGHWAQGALRRIIQAHIRHLESLDDEYMRERSADLRDIGRRVLSHLQKNTRTLPQYAERTILMGEEITPTDLAEVPEGYLAGVICTKGSSISHVAILARALNVPTVMGVSDASILEWQDKEIIVDGYYGQVYVSPTTRVCEVFQRIANDEKQLDDSLQVLRDKPAITKDAHRVVLMVNAGLGADIGISLAAGAEGVGLYRTEIPFLIRERFPSSEEQRVIYRQLLTSFSPRPVIMRILDIGGDKALPYFPVKEDNPFLGWRGIRVLLDHPEIFLAQVRAMLQASVGFNNLRIMLPMITDVSEVDEALRLLKKAYAEILEEGYNIEVPQVGIMMEVPSAIYQARALAKRVDFLSVGSNDLTQYLLAVDRNNSRVANLFDSLHPAVLRAFIQIVEHGHQEGKHVSICGEIASDPVAVMLLVAIGFDSLSMNASSLSRVKSVIRQFTKKKASKLLQEVLSMESGVMIRCHMELALEKAGLGNLIRAGR
jgi:phosphotransferase system, enzyme I, PtsP